jgi:hypothetical protein
VVLFVTRPPPAGPLCHTHPTAGPFTGRTGSGLAKLIKEYAYGAARP